MPTEPGLDPASFRDPSGQVHSVDGRIFRTVTDHAIDDFEFVQASGVYASLVAAGKVIAADPVDETTRLAVSADARHVLEHPKLPIVSYPYEWTFSQLKAAALLHLDIQIEALAQDVMLSDATAYNVQFIGAKPIFIDTLSFRRYRDGEYWTGHQQFCEQFLIPLLLAACFGTTHNAWYRGTLEGIPRADFVRLLRLRHKLSWRVLTQLVLPSSFDRSAQKGNIAVGSSALAAAKFPKQTLERMLRRLQGWIEGLRPKYAKQQTIWQNYATQTSYSDTETTAKRAAIGRFVADVKPGILWDLGCNSGDYSELALENGAGHVVGWDFDMGALEAAFARAGEKELAFTALYFDAANPSPDQGWAQRERRGMAERGPADAVLALALVHHLAIAKNLPLVRVANWLTGLGRTGIVEFVTKEDPMVQELLKMREDIFPDYTLEAFLASLSAHAEVSDVEALGTRHLITYRNKP